MIFYQQQDFTQEYEPLFFCLFFNCTSLIPLKPKGDQVAVRVHRGEVGGAHHGALREVRQGRGGEEERHQPGATSVQLSSVLIH